MKQTINSAVGELTLLHHARSCGLYLPAKPHISPSDGGHLMVIPDRRIEERSKLNPFEALELVFLSIVGGKLLKRQHGAAWINYQENGNWRLDSGKETILHLHVYGRSRAAKAQPYGESLSFPLRKDLQAWQVDAYTDSEIKADIMKVGEIIQEQWTEPFYEALDALEQTHICK